MLDFIFNVLLGGLPIEGKIIVIGFFLFIVLFIASEG